MAGAGQPWYMPLFWPVAHSVDAIQRPADAKASKPEAVAKLDLIGHMTSVIAASRSFGLAYLCWHFTPNALESGAAKELVFDWMWPIFFRNICGTFLVAGLWDWLLYWSPLSYKFKAFKFNPKYPSKTQMLHDMFWTVQASCCAALLEIAMLHIWATGQWPYAKTLSDQHLFINLFWIVGLTHWRVIHFWAVHRFMHPWFTKTIPDVGKFMYAWVHSLHHKSSNPSAFSGTSMHPVEATMYYSAALVPALFGAHPSIFLAVIFDCGIGAWLGHDGFQWPGSGDFFHQVHHQWYDCNYGAMHCPIDKWLGTFKNKGIPGAVYDEPQRARSVGPKDN